MFQLIPFGDKNLQKIVPQFYRTEKNLISVAGKLDVKSRTKFICKDMDSGGYVINCFIEGKTYFEIMDCMVNIRGFGWNRIEEYLYQLDDGLYSYEKTFKRRNNFDRDRSQAALPFMKFIDSLSEGESSKLTNMETRGVAFYELPKDIQNSLREVAKVYESENERNKGFANRVESGRVYVNKLPSAGFHHMLIGFSVPGGSYGLGVHDFEDWKTRRSEIGEKQTRMDYKKSKVSLSDWRKSPDGKKKVSFQGYASPEVVLMDIARRYKVNIMCDSKKMWKISASLYLKDIPISEFLDSITSRFPKTEWEVRDSGVIIIRGPDNPYNQLRKAA